MFIGRIFMNAVIEFSGLLGSVHIGFCHFLAPLWLGIITWLVLVNAVWRECSLELDWSTCSPVWTPTALSPSTVVVGVWDCVSLVWKGGNKMSMAPPCTYEKHIMWVRNKTIPSSYWDNEIMSTEYQPILPDRKGDVYLLFSFWPPFLPQLLSPLQLLQSVFWAPTGPVSFLPNQSTLRN